MSTFSRPRALLPEDRYGEFDCGEPSLDDWLRTRAVKNETTGASRTFVSIHESGAIAGYYCLSASSLLLEDAPGKVRRNMPSPIPVILIGRLAVDSSFKGSGLGASLLQDAVLKGLEASRIVGARAFIVDALNESAERFYSKFGFELMPPSSKRAMHLLIKDAEATIAGMKSYGRAPTFLLATGYEQVRSITTYLTGDLAAATRIDLVLPATGVCSTDVASASCCS